MKLIRNIYGQVKFSIVILVDMIHFMSCLSYQDINVDLLTVMKERQRLIIPNGTKPSMCSHMVPISVQHVCITHCFDVDLRETTCFYVKPISV